MWQRLKESRFFLLQAVLTKECHKAGMPEIEGGKVNGNPRYLPAIHAWNSQGGVHQDKLGITIAVVLSPEDVQILDMLTEIGKFNSRGEALAWLAHEGIESKRQGLEQDENVVNQIKHLKKSVSI